MARLAKDNPRKLALEPSTPHSVSLIYHKHDSIAALKWIRMPEQQGVFRYDEGYVRIIYWFSNENTAFDFKLRFG